MKEVLNEIISRIKEIEYDEHYKNWDDYVLVGIDEGIERAIDIIKEYLD